MKQEKPASVEVPQHNAISRSIYSLSVNARRLIAMAMSKLKFKDGGYENRQVEFAIGEFMKELGIERGSRTYALILDAVRECLKCHIEVWLGRGEWVGWTWFTEARLKSDVGFGDGDWHDHLYSNDIKATHDYSALTGPDSVTSWDTVIMKFNPDLSNHLKSFANQYSKIKLADLGKLQSIYAIRFYELAMSYKYLKGKGGNDRGEWYFPERPYSILELRRLLAVGKTKYERTNNFRRFCVDYPCQEINEAGIGLEIYPQYERRGKYLSGVWFKCREQVAGEPRTVSPVTESEKEDEAMRQDFEDHPDKEKFYREEAWKKYESLNPLIKGLIEKSEVASVDDFIEADMKKSYREDRAAQLAAGRGRRRAKGGG